MGAAGSFSLAAAAVFVLAFGFSSALLKASDYFNICKTSDSNLNECIRNSINHFRPKLLKGIPEANLPPYEVLKIPHLQFKGKFALMDFDVNLTHIVSTGQGDYEITEAKFDPKALTLKLKESLPHMNASAHYVHEGPLSFVAKEGEVHFLVNAITKDIDIQFEIQNRGDDKILQVKEWKWTWECESGSFYCSNMNSGSGGMLAAIAKQLVNLSKNFKLAFKMFKYLPERELGTYFKEMVNKLLQNFCAQDLLPQ
ncbi:uncharacterized protein [Periplaneta americana]|uniref:uncharacterized protein n=1 Tax=Periplaneta americana TaxID=6978 RepID=UPI0037E80375